MKPAPVFLKDSLSELAQTGVPWQRMSVKQKN